MRLGTQVEQMQEDVEEWIMFVKKWNDRNDKIQLNNTGGKTK